MDASGVKGQNPTRNNNHVRVQRRTLESLLQQCQMALQQLTSDCDDDLVDAEDSADTSSPSCSDDESAQFSNLLKSRIECDDFLEKLENARALLPHTAAEEASSWDVVSENDLWEGGDDIEREDYVLVRQEDIVEGIACFMAGYLLSLKETKDITPNKLQEALSKTFSNKRKKGKLRKAWDGSRVVYNVASWGATAVGIYQNPAILRAASAAFWTSCHVISKLL